MMRGFRPPVVAAAILAGSSGSPAQNPPYDAVPATAPPVWRVRYEASAGPDGLAYPASYTVWIPPGVATLRGVIVHQHGCGEGSCKSGLTGAYDLHWRALAKAHGCALLAPAYEQPEKADCQKWCDPRNGSGAAFQRALADLGARSGHPELASVPWALWGHSGGGHWAGGMVLLYPDRVAAAWLRSGVPLLQTDPARPAVQPFPLPEAALSVPMMCNLGTKEGVTLADGRFKGVWPANRAFFTAVRARGGRIGIAIDPLTGHECGNQRYLAIPWFDACLRARLPVDAGGALRPMPLDAAWLAAVGETKAVPAASFRGDPLTAVWLPDEAVARAWMQYARDTAVADATPPPAPANLRVVGNVLTWEAEADLDSGLARFVIERDGQIIARVPEKDSNPFGRPVFQGLQYSDTPPMPLAEMRFVDDLAEPGRARVYRVFAENTVGLRSPPGAQASTDAAARRPLVEHVVVRKPPPGRGLMAPNNGGIWSWGDEIVVMYLNGPHRNGTGWASHSTEANAPGVTMDTSRSLDGGRTWGDHRVAFKRHTERCGWPGPAPTLLTEPIDFQDPGTIVHFQRDDAGRTLFYVSRDRGRTWRGPHSNIPKFLNGVNGRTNYEVTGPRSLTAYMEMDDAAPPDRHRFRSRAVHTDDGGLTWTLGAEISVLPPFGSGRKREWATHPSVVRLDAGTLIATFRSGHQNSVADRTAWFDATRSTDGGRTWSHLARLGESPGNNGCPSATVVVPMPGGASRVVALMWVRPPDRNADAMSRLIARYSDDRGDTWSAPILLRDDARGWDTGYPIAAVRPDGRVVVCYWMKTVDQNEPNYIAATIWDARGAPPTPPPARPAGKP